MSTGDKANYFLEQQVPQLQELQRKEILSPEEIKFVVRTRSDFEHTINARGHHASDYAAYATYELNLAALVKKRIARKKVKLGVSGHEGPRRIFFILERGVRKFQGDLGLWMQLLQFARKEKARKKTKELLTRVLRLHPVKSELWIYAAKYMLEDESDINGARGYMQRGLRFCKRDQGLWIEYARLECVYVAKIAARRKILGIDGQKETARASDRDEDMLALPTVTAEDVNPTLEKEDKVDEVALQNLESTPALTGAIPIAIFDTAMKEFDNIDMLGELFFNMAADFERGPAFDRILRHIVARLGELQPDGVGTITCQFMLPMSGVDLTNEDFPSALAESLSIIRDAMKRLPLSRKAIATRAISHLLPVASQQDLDSDLRTALQASLRQYIRAVDASVEIKSLAQRLSEQKRVQEAKVLLSLSQKEFPAHKELATARKSLDAPKEITMTAG